jgi:diaminohydroxyphosphoribosylaminopyrimidine deaminase / 5-amino-6-(5-phosphoribosylamino)uracil reductase
MPASFDNDMMARALRLARRGLYSTDPNPRVGCVIVRDEEIVGEGFTSPVGGPHAEVNALLAAGDAARGATAYVTLEPCSHHGRTPPCADALVKAGVKRVVYALGDPNPRLNGGGAAALQAAGIKVSCGPMAAQARELNVGFFHRMETGRPWVTVKVGASIDGKVALASGESRWVTSEDSRADVQRQRGRSSAILTGTGTMLADDPLLTIRAPDVDMQGRRVLRVICDSQLRTSPQSRLFKEPGAVLVLTTSRDPSLVEPLIAVGAEVLPLATDETGRVELRSALELLGSRECNEVLVEAGPRLSGRFVELGLANELLIYSAPVVLGGEARSMFTTEKLEALSARWAFEFHEVGRTGKDMRVRLRPVKGA